jgi:hypothetical protein
LKDLGIQFLEKTMSYNGTVHVTDKTGWAKTFPLEKALTMIGSAAFNDIVLPESHGSGVASVHIQLISSQPGNRGFRMVNLVSDPLEMSLSEARGKIFVPAKGSRALTDGDGLKLGDFQLTFYLQSTHGISIDKRSENIGVTYEMPSLILKEGRKLTGLLTVRNFGGERRCQFEIDLEGLPSDCYQVDPAPLLYPGGEEKLQIRFFHLGVRPPAGDCPILIRISAAGAYPTEEVLIPIVLNVEAVNRFQVEVLEDPSALEFQEKTTIQGPVAPVIVTANVDHSQSDLSQPSDEGLKELSQIQQDDPKSETDDNSDSKPDVEVENIEETDWWSDSEQSSTQINNDPLTLLKRGKSKLSVPKSKVQVLKVTTEDSLEKTDE